MSSTRLPGKVMLCAAGKPVLQHHVERLRQSGLPIIIATTSHATDDPIARFAEENAIPLFRGDEQNVLSRYFMAAQKYELEVIIRVTSDCPLIDGALVKEGLQQYLEIGDKNLYLSNSLQRTFPRGFDFEIFSFHLLKEAYENASKREEKEHVTPYINQNRSGKVKIEHFLSEQDSSGYRLTLDTEDDWKLLNILIEGHKADQLDYKQIIRLLGQHPELAAINAHVEQKKL